MPDPRPDDRRRELDADVVPVDTDTDTDGSVIVTPRGSYDAPAAYTGRVSDMKRDSDGDGLTDWQEYERRTGRFSLTRTKMISHRGRLVH